MSVIHLGKINMYVFLLNSIMTGAENIPGVIFPQSLVTVAWLKLLLREQIHEDLKVGKCVRGTEFDHADLFAL